MECQHRPKIKKQTFGEGSREAEFAIPYRIEERNVFFTGQSDRRINFEMSTASCTCWEICFSYPVESFGWEICAK